MVSPGYRPLLGIIRHDQRTAVTYVNITVLLLQQSLNPCPIAKSTVKYCRVLPLCRTRMWHMYDADVASKYFSQEVVQIIESGLFALVLVGNG